MEIGAQICGRIPGGFDFDPQPCHPLKVQKSLSGSETGPPSLGLSASRPLGLSASRPLGQARVQQLQEQQRLQQQMQLRAQEAENWFLFSSFFPFFFCLVWRFCQFFVCLFGVYLFFLSFWGGLFLFCGCLVCLLFFLFSGLQ